MENGEHYPVTRRECNIRHQEVEDMKQEIKTQHKMLWGIVVLHIATLGAIIGVLLKGGMGG